MPEHSPSQEHRTEHCTEQRIDAPLQGPHGGGHEAAPTPAVVLDTNIVLDWFWFADARVAGVASALQSGTQRWVATLPMRAELDRVLARLPPWRHGVTREQVLAAFDRHVSIVDIAPPAFGLHCTDADDQPFIDLAIHAGARWLFSRDRAVLKLARRAATFGCSIAAPEQLLKA